MSITIPGGRHRAPKHDVTAWPRLGHDEISVVDALRAVPEDPDPQPSYTPKAAMRETGAMPALTEEPPAETPILVSTSSPEALRQVLGVLDSEDFSFAALDEAKAVEGLTYAGVMGTRGSVPGHPEGVVRGMLIESLGRAARGCQGPDFPGCGDCGEGWLCAVHIDILQLAMTYEELRDFAAQALTDEAALDRVAEACRDGSADAWDLGSPGSPLAAVLEAALAGGAR